MKVCSIKLCDATNAFNLLNRRIALINIHAICPSIATALTNFYRGSSDLFIQGQTLKSREGIMQGDPLAMSMYALGILPLIQKLDGTKQVWFADDAAAGASVDRLKEWWDDLLKLGPAYGYHPNPEKTWLIVKEESLDDAAEAFRSSGVNIVSSGRKYLGAALGCTEFVKRFMRNKIQEWCDEIECLSMIARREPHAAYSALIHGVTNRWLYVMRTLPDISDMMKPLEQCIRCKLIPAIIGRHSVSDTEREILALPCRLGGLGLINPTRSAAVQYNGSEKITAPLVSLILNQGTCPPEIWEEMKSLKATVRSENKAHAENEAAAIELDAQQKKTVEMAKEKGASAWLTTLPLEKYGFALYRSEFRDAIALRYNWLPDRLPTQCACNAPFTVDHAFSCPKGAFPTFRHNDLRDITGGLLSEVCKEVSLEPVLQTLEGHPLHHLSANTEDCARSDIQAKGFWGIPHQRAFFDIKVFNPYARSNSKFSTPSCYVHHEKMKRRQYEQRINEVEMGSFTPVIFSATGGMGKAATIFYQRLAHMVSERRNESYSSTISWMRCTLNFSLIRSAVMCLRGSRCRFQSRLPDSVDATNYEARIHS
jgi:hypothetical protein